MAIRETVNTVLEALYCHIVYRDEEEMKKAVADWLKDAHYYVASDEKELKELALEFTNLVEPKW